MSDSQTPRILVADDQPDVLEALELLGKSEGFSVTAVASPRAVLKAVQAEEFDAALIDLTMRATRRPAPKAFNFFLSSRRWTPHFRSSS